MSDNEGNDNSNSGKSSDRLALMIGAIGLLAIALLLLPPLPPWFRVIAVVLVVLAVLEGLGVLPRLRAIWRRWLSDLPSDDQRSARWKRAFGLIGIPIVALLLLPHLPPRLRVVAVVLAALAVLGVVGVFPKLRAAWRRWLSGLITILVIILALQAYGPLRSLGFWQGGNGPAGAWGLGPLGSRPILSWVPDRFIPTTRGTIRRFTLTPSGELDGLIPDDGTEVHVPPHLSAQLAAAVRLGDGFAATLIGRTCNRLNVVSLGTDKKRKHGNQPATVS